MFRVGSKVKCVECGQGSSLEIGKVYTISSISGAIDKNGIPLYISVTELRGLTYYGFRFKLVDDEQPMNLPDWF